VQGLEVHEVYLKLWVALYHLPYPHIRGKIDAGNHIPNFRCTREKVTFDFKTEIQTVTYDEDGEDLFEVPSSEEREELLEKLKAVPKPVQRPKPEAVPKPEITQHPRRINYLGIAWIVSYLLMALALWRLSK
jgi:hypothetical protein